MQELAFNYSDILGIPCDSVIATFRMLQNHALEKLASKNQFLQTGLATLRVKAVGMDVPPKTITMQLTESGEALKEKIFNEMCIPRPSR